MRTSCGSSLLRFTEGPWSAWLTYVAGVMMFLSFISVVIVASGIAVSTAAVLHASKVLMLPVANIVLRRKAVVIIEMQSALVAGVGKKAWGIIVPKT